MGRKKQVQQPPPVQQPEAAQQPPPVQQPEAAPTQDGTVRPRTGLADALRHALNTLGIEADTADVKNHVKQQFPGVDTDTPSFGSSLSTMRKKLRGDASPASPRRTTSSNAAATIEDLKKVKKIASQRGGLGTLLKQVQDVTDLASEVGGLDRLRRAIEDLHDLTKDEQ